MNTFINDSLKLNDKEKTNDLSTEEKDNPYAYLERQDFTSEKFKIEVRGLPKYYGIGELKKLLNDKLKLGSNKIKPPKRGSEWVYVCFRSDQDREEALKVLNGFTWKKKVLTADLAKPAPDPLVKRRNEDQSQDPKRRKIDSNQTQEEILKTSITPLWNVPYNEQLQQKTNDIKKILRNIKKEILRANPSLKPWLNKQSQKYDGLPCELLDIRYAQEHDGYRNKCEFTIGINEETGEKTVGFRLGSYATGTIGVGPIHCLNNVPERVKEAAQTFEKHVRSSSLDVFNPETHSGYWRQLTARLAMNTNELMLIVGFHPQALTDEELQKVKKDIVDFFTDLDGRTLNVTSLYFQIIKRKKFGESQETVEHLLGESHITEILCGLKFQISPLAFFQINTPAAELLYNNVRSLCKLSSDTTLLDIFCGTGTIGLSLAKDCGQVLGLDLMESAVEDARKNAALNNIENCEFFCGAAEEILSSVFMRTKHQNVVAVVDPPRAGLRQNAVVILRRTTKVTKMAYISCDIKAASKNIVDLARPSSKTMAGDPFVPVAAVPVDLFPHTRHCELAIYFERISASELKSLKDESRTAELNTSDAVNDVHSTVC